MQKKFYDGRDMIINAFKDKTFSFSPEGFPEYVFLNTPKQEIPIDEISDFGIKEIFN